MKKKMLIVLSIVLHGVITALLVLVWHPWQMQQDLDLIEVPVAKNTLFFRHRIEETDLIMVQLPQDQVQPMAVLDPQRLIDQVVSSEIMIAKGSLFTEEMVEDPNQIMDRSSLMLHQGQAALPLSVDLIQGGGNTLRINQKIDLYCLVQQRNEKPITDLLVQAVRIVDLRDRKGLSLDDPAGTGVASVVILAIEQSLIPVLSAANQLGTLQLYVSDSAWQSEKECLFYEESKVLPYLLEQSKQE